MKFASIQQKDINMISILGLDDKSFDFTLLEEIYYYIYFDKKYLEIVKSKIKNDDTYRCTFLYKLQIKDGILLIEERNADLCL